MRIAKVIMLVLIVGVASIAARQLIHMQLSNADKANVTKPVVHSQKAIEIVSAVPRDETGKYDLGDIALLANGDAWAVGYDGKHIGRVYYSKDRGKTWDAVDVPGNDFTLKALSFSDSQHGWAVGGNGLVIRTINGGKSWELMETPTTFDLQAVHFVNSQVGFIAGKTALLNRITDEVSGSFEILCTKNGGETWRRCYKEDKPSNVFQITTFSESVAFALLDGNRLIRTDDQGKTWREVPLSAKHIFSIAFAPDGAGWIVGNQGVFQRSGDGGKTWQQPTSLAQNFMSKNWEAVNFNDTGIGLAVGENGALALTRDNGNTWEIQTLATSDHLRAVRLQGSSAIVLGAQNIYWLAL